MGPLNPNSLNTRMLSRHQATRRDNTDHYVNIETSASKVMLTVVFRTVSQEALRYCVPYDQNNRNRSQLKHVTMRQMVLFLSSLFHVRLDVINTAQRTADQARLLRPVFFTVNHYSLSLSWMPISYQYLPVRITTDF